MYIIVGLAYCLVKNNYYEPVKPLKLQHTCSDHHLFSPGSVILKQAQIMRIKGLITKDKINWLGFSKNLSQLTTTTHVENYSGEENCCDYIEALKVEES